MAVFALSPRVTLGSRVLFDFSGSLGRLRLAVFRATGRFFWPLGTCSLGWALAVLISAPALAGGADGPAHDRHDAGH